MRFADDVLFTGRLAPEKLSDVMGAALALVFVPFFEGFGIPVLEAMYCDVPVVASNTTSIPEVGGEAVLYTNPYSINSIASAMKQIASDHNLRFLLVENSRKQREKFSWDITAEKLWESMMKTME